MVVVVAVNGETPAGRGAEKGNVFRVPGDRFRLSRAADVTIQADHPVGCLHDQMQIVRDQQHTATAPPPNAADQGEKLRLPVDVDALNRFVEHQQIGIAKQCPAQEEALELAAGNALYRTLDDPVDTDLVENGADPFLLGAAAEGEKPGHGQGQDVIDE